MARNLQGSLPVGAIFTSGTVSAFGAITAGHVTLNTIAMPAIDAVADAAARVDQLVTLFNQYADQTGVRAEKVTSVTYRLKAGVDIVIAALGATANAANTGLTAGTTAKTDVLMATRKAFGSGSANDDTAIVKLGSMEVTVAAAKKMGLIDRIAGTDVELQGAQTPTRTDA